MTGDSYFVWHFLYDVCQDIGVTGGLWRGSVALSQAAARDTQLSGESGQTGDRASWLPAVVVLKHGATGQDDHSRFLSSVAAREIENTLWLNTSYGAGPFRCVLLDMGGKLRKTECVFTYELLV